MRESQKNIFSVLSRKDTIITMRKVTDFRTEIVIWKKGDERRYQYTPINFDESALVLHCQPTIKHRALKDCHVLINFEHDRLQFFTTGNVQFDQELQEYAITFDDKIYKCDKRQSFRIETSDCQKLAVGIGQLELPAEDISLGGLSFVIPSNKIVEFRIGQIIPSLKVFLNSYNFIIDSAEVRYVKEMKHSHHQVHDLKVGLQFSPLDDKTEQALFREINNSIYNKLQFQKD